MAYLGGKATGANHIIKILNNEVFDGMSYIEPFCGYCHILRRVKSKSSYTISDSNDLLIVLLKHIQTSSKEHPSISEEEYKKLRADPSSDPLRAAYAAFTYSYNGKFFAGYVGSKERDYPSERKRYYERLHANEVFQKANIKQGSYTIYNSRNTEDALIYCDPPYEATEGYRNEFNSDEFWDWVRKMSKKNIVLVSEYQAPLDFICIGQQSKRQTVAAKAKTRRRLESVFVHDSLSTHPAILKVIEDSRKTYPCDSKYFITGAGRAHRRTLKRSSKN